KRRCCMLELAPWNPVFSAPPAENGIPLRWTNPPDAARATSKTARSAASRTSCASNTTRRRRNSSSPPNWSEANPNRPKWTKCTSIRQWIPLGEEFRERLLALGEGAFHLAADENCVRDRPQEAEPNFIVDHVADQRSGDACASLRLKFVAMMPELEWTFVLHVGEVMVPLEFGDARDPLCAQRQERED